MGCAFNRFSPFPELWLIRRVTLRPRSSPCVMDIATHRHPGSVPHLTAHPGMAHPPFPIVDKQAQATKTLRRLKNSLTTCSPANLMAFRGHNTSGNKRRSFGKLMQMGLKISTFPAPSRRGCCKSQDLCAQDSHAHRRQVAAHPSARGLQECKHSCPAPTWVFTVVGLPGTFHHFTVFYRWAGNVGSARRVQTHFGSNT